MRVTGTLLFALLVVVAGAAHGNRERVEIPFVDRGSIDDWEALGHEAILIEGLRTSGTRRHSSDRASGCASVTPSAS